jgi:hypothetical protein
MMSRRSILATCIAFIAGTAPAWAGSPEPSPAAQPVTVHYVAGLQPHNSFQAPYSGALTLTFTPDGHINGTYRAQSVRPDPLNGRIVSVLGGRTGSDIHLAFGTGLGFTVRGTVQPNGHIVASGFGKSTQWNFEAIPNSKK